MAEHLAIVLDAVPVLGAERRSLDAARGLVAAEDVRSATATPPFDNSAMDGYAVHSADLRGVSESAPVALVVVADLPAGSADNPTIDFGQAARIMTGAPIPDGIDAVVPIEHTDEGTATVLVFRPPRAGAHLRRAGEDAAAGDRVVSAGSVMWPTRLAAAASAGADAILVHPAPRVAVISTGSELVAPGHPLRRGQIPDSNSFLLSAAVTEAGGVATRIGAVPDDPDALREVLARIAPTVDAMVLSGGVSVGAFDVVKAVLAPLDTMFFGPILMQPGKPQGFGRLPQGPVVFALPGNPVSAYVSFEAFVRPALLRMAGHTSLHRRTITAVADDAWTCPAGRMQYMPVVVEGEPGRERVKRATSGGSSSHLIAGLGRSTGLAVIPEQLDRVEAGDRLTVMVTTSP
ncbi:gephyrin-like molybdotransferase Glp [Glaciihabitans tibetensis]|uniref:molybdopterin molybdotransferase MoeA n=1 Tax=Glaciihabitans tibetensis TaxID=1266600 RepID=UPI001FE82A26|nr:gephyrin-like molybdotransferase Glp [Glaciihabitans tibetensis]